MLALRLPSDVYVFMRGVAAVVKLGIDVPRGSEPTGPRGGMAPRGMEKNTGDPDPFSATGEVWLNMLPWLPERAAERRVRSAPYSTIFKHCHRDYLQ